MATIFHLVAHRNLALGSQRLHTTTVAFYNAPPHRGPASDHFDGTRFRNTDRSIGHATAPSLLEWMLNRDMGPWQRIDQPPGPKPVVEVARGACRVTLVGHATLLVQMHGLNMLTDPVWATRIGPVSWAGPKRYRAPALRFDELPPIHLVLLSHNHYDHLCLPTMRRLWAEHRAPVVTGLGNAALLKQHGIENVVELDWWQTQMVGDVEITGVEMQHFSGRGPTDRDVTLWMGLTVHHPDGQVLFCGDTGYGEHFTRIRERVGSPRVALIPIGAFRPRWFMKRVHVDPHEAVQAHLDLGADRSVAMHYGTFKLADDGMDEPVRALAEARSELGVAEEAFRVLEHGHAAEL